MFYVRAWRNSVDSVVELHNSENPNYMGVGPLLSIPLDELDGVIQALQEAKQFANPDKQSYKVFASDGSIVKH